MSARDWLLQLQRKEVERDVRATAPHLTSDRRRHLKSLSPTIITKAAAAADSLPKIVVRRILREKGRRSGSLHLQCQSVVAWVKRSDSGEGREVIASPRGKVQQRQREAATFPPSLAA